MPSSQPQLGLPQQLAIDDLIICPGEIEVKQDETTTWPFCDYRMLPFVYTVERACSRYWARLWPYDHMASALLGARFGGEHQITMKHSPQERPLLICAHCRRVCTPSGHWIHDEQGTIQGALFISHGICPDCMQRLFPEFSDEPEDLELAHSSPQGKSAPAA